MQFFPLLAEYNDPKIDKKKQKNLVLPRRIELKLRHANNFSLDDVFFFFYLHTHNIIL